MSKLNNFTVYIAGPMSGIDKNNFPAFDKAAETLRRAGWDVINPPELFRQRLGGRGNLTAAELDKLMAEELDIVKTCHAIYLLRGWENSPGAKRELRTALEFGLAVRLQEDAQ